MSMCSCECSGEEGCLCLFLSYGTDSENRGCECSKCLASSDTGIVVQL